VLRGNLCLSISICLVGCFCRSTRNTGVSLYQIVLGFSRGLYNALSVQGNSIWENYTIKISLSVSASRKSGVVL